MKLADERENTIHQLAMIRFPEKLEHGIDANSARRRDFETALRQQPQHFPAIWLRAARLAEQTRLQEEAKHPRGAGRRHT